MSRACVRVGTAGWAIPAEQRARLPAAGSGLERYAAVLNAAEINSTFYRRHRPDTYARWSASVPAGFRFAVKLPKAISHEARLHDCHQLLADFAGDIVGLDGKRGPALLQLPPSLVFDRAAAATFLDSFAALVGGALVCEPRHASWFERDAEALFVEHRVARVAADPARAAGGGQPGGWGGLVYNRLHGSPQIYRSAYEPAAIAAQARSLADHIARGIECWTIYDNTASGAALANALDLIGAA